MKFALLAAVLAAVATVNVVIATEDADTAWINFQSKYSKEYQSSEHESLRKKIFIENFNKIAEHNDLYGQGKVPHSLVINEFADMTNEEFRSIFNGHKIAKLERENIEQFVPDNTKQIPDEFDWREKGAVTPVKNQGKCGSCWAFSSTGALEGQHFLKTGKLDSISEQNLVDCSIKYGNDGCNGGLMNLAFKYVHANDGIDSETSYPYEGKTLKCRYKSDANVTSVKGYVQIESGNEESLKAAIATIGPISVAIDASHSDFMFYHSGVYYNKSCHNNTKNLDHGVLVVGYGTEKKKDYWLVKNSWGPGWGDKGYIKMARNTVHNCGIAAAASYPTNY